MDDSRAMASCACSRCGWGLFGHFYSDLLGWSDGAMVLGKLPWQGRPTNLHKSRARAYCACSRCGWGLFGHFFSRLLFLFSSPSLWETVRYKLKYCLKGPLSPKTTNNLLSSILSLLYLRGGRVVRWCWVNFQCRGVLQFGLQ